MKALIYKVFVERISVPSAINRQSQEQGSLADFLAVLFGAHQSEGVLIFLGGAFDIHGGRPYAIFHGM